MYIIQHFYGFSLFRRWPRNFMQSLNIHVPRTSLSLTTMISGKLNSYKMHTPCDQQYGSPEEDIKMLDKLSPTIGQYTCSLSLALRNSTSCISEFAQMLKASWSYFIGNKLRSGDLKNRYLHFKKHTGILMLTKTWVPLVNYLRCRW